MNPSSLAAAVIFLPPLLAGLAIGLAGRTLRDTAHRLGVPAGAAVCTAAIYMLSRVPSEGPVVIRLPGPDPAVHWLTFGLYVDRLSAVMLVLIALVSLIIQVYSINYVRGDRGYARFYALVNLLTAVLLAMVASANLLMLVMCWQLVSWLLYLLLAYHYPNLPAIRSAWKTWVVQRIGDVAALAGAFLAYKVYGTLEFPALFERAATVTADLAWWAGGPSISAPTAVTLLLLIAAMARSAQLPFHVWLPETMDTPTPVSALMHAGIVNAGGFLINRLAPLYGLAPTTLHVAFMIGGLTAILGAAMMLTQSDIKKALGYSTMGQMGYMTMECGLGAFALAIFHLIAHGIFKATLFLNAGSLIHESRREPHVPPIRRVPDHDGAPGLHWFTGLVMTLILPLVILMTTHGLLHVPLLEAQGVVIFLFFAWVTSSQAILSLYRVRAVASWYVAALMVGTLALVVVTYLWAGEAFTAFLYPEPGESGAYFQAAGIHPRLFDLFVGVVTVLIVGGWVVVYTNVKGEHALIPRSVARLLPRLYVWCWKRLYIDALYAAMGRAALRLAGKLDARLPQWLG